MLDDWRRDVPECNAEAFARWIVHCESKGKQLGPTQRLYPAKQLAGNGDFDAQREVVDYCIGKPYYSLIPIGDVRARLRGMTRNAPDTRTPAQVEAQRLRKLMDDRPKSPWKVLREFRDPNPGETSEQYNAAMTEAFAQSQPRDVPRLCTCRVGLSPTGKRRLFTAHTQSGPTGGPGAATQAVGPRCDLHSM